ncbi:MAG: DUF4373 domain-containing protein [Clostridiales bacterium]|nr:DUF4373 domain-containing protein [Clostridiales bacterium]
MARPGKRGVDYLPLDIHMNDSMKFVEMKFGLKGFAVVVKLWMKIYDNGYYCEWNEDVALMFADDNRVGVNVVSEILSEAIKRGIFDKQLYDKFGILTSQGIQQRYLEMTSRRKRVDLNEEYLLIDVPENTVNVYINGINVSNNPENDYSNSQSKVKESKVNKSKVNESNTADRAAAVFERYENTTGRNVTKTMMSDVDSFIADGAEVDLILEIIDYAVDAGKGNWNYMRAVLNNLLGEGIRTMSAYKAKRAERSTVKQSTAPNVQKSKFNNYEDTNKIDYAALERKLLDDMVSGA